MQTRFQKSLAADLSLVLATVIWGTTFVVVKITVNAMHPVALNAIRFLLAAFVMFLFLKIRRIKVWENWRYGLVLGLILWVIFHTQTVGLQYTTATNSGLLTGLFVLFTPLLGRILFKHHFSLLRVLACCQAMFGLWLLTGGLHDFNRGDFLSIITAIAVAFQILYVDLYAKRIENRLALNFQQLLVVGVVSLVTALVFGNPLSVATPASWLALVYLAVLATVLTLSIQLVAQRYTSALKATLIFSLEPVFAAIFAWWWGGEVLTPLKIFGGVLIVLATVFSELPVETWLAAKKALQNQCKGVQHV